MDIRTTKMITDALRHLGDVFDSDWLAYAALTGKIELPLCSALAWHIRKTAMLPKLKIVREWSPPGSKEWSPSGKKIQFDLAVLQDDAPCALIEAKQWNDFDIARWLKGSGPKNPREGTAKDIERLRAAPFDCAKYILSFCVHCDPPPLEEHGQEIKYLRERRALRKTNKAEINAGYERLQETWGSLTMEAKDEIPAGHALGVDVVVYYRLLTVL